MAQSISYATPPRRKDAPIESCYEPHHPAVRRAYPLLLLLAATVSCAGSSRRVMREQIGGVMRARAFASPSAYEAYLRAELAMARGDPATAAAQVELAITADPSDGFLAARRVEVLLAAGRTAEAMRAAEEATRQHPSHASVWIALGEVLRARGDTRGVAEAMQRAAAIAPDDPDVRAAVAAQQGGSEREVALARRGAPQAREGDRTLARHALLDPRGDARRWSATRRRLIAATRRAQNDWAGVDHALTPAVLGDPENVRDREAVIEARARDGRPRDAAALVAALPRDERVLPLARRALAWWLVHEAQRADEDAAEALRSNPDDALALRVRAQAVAAQGDVSSALTLLARVPLDAPWQWAGELARDAWGVPGRERVDAAGRDVSDRYRAFVCARLVAAELLTLAGRGALARRVLDTALQTLRGRVDGAASRDALRLALSVRADAGGAPDGDFGALETVWARHRRALATGEPAALAERSGDPQEDAAADAWRVILGARDGCASGAAELRALLARVEATAPRSPLTLRARATLDAHPRCAR